MRIKVAANAEEIERLVKIKAWLSTEFPEDEMART
jgi:hypothetical protein